MAQNDVTQWSPEEKWANRVLNYLHMAKSDIDRWRNGDMIPVIMNDFRLSMDEMLFSMFDFPDDFPDDDSTLSPLTFLSQLFGAGYAFFTNRAVYNTVETPQQPKGHGVKLPDGTEAACWTGGLGGYTQTYRPAYITIANPYLAETLVCNLEEDGVLIKCGPAMRGYGDTIDKWAMLYAQAIVTMCADIIQSRVMTMIHAKDDNAADAADEFYNQLWHGNQQAIKTTGTMWENPDYNPLSAYPQATTAGNLLVNVIEVTQFVIAKCLQEMGLQANHNMKREAVNESEAGMNIDSLTPRPQSILSCIKSAGRKIKDKYGVDWFERIELNDAWRREELVAEASAALTEEFSEEEVETTEEVETDETEEIGQEVEINDEENV